MDSGSPIANISAWISAHWEGWRIANFVHLLWILAISIALMRLLHILERRVVAAASQDGKTSTLRQKQIQTLAGLLRSTGNVLIIAFAVLTVLPELGVSVAPLTVAAGLASVALGFGSQNLVRDWINGALIAFEDQFVVGETVKIGEVTGRVEQLTLRHTVLRDPQGALVHIPNGEIRVLSNLSRDYSQVFLDVQVPVGEQGDRALAALDQVAAEFRGDAAWAPAMVDGPRVLGIESLAPGGATVRVQVRTSPLRQYDVARELRRRIVARFNRDGVDFASEQRVVLVNPAEAPRAAQEEAGASAAHAGTD